MRRTDGPQPRRGVALTEMAAVAPFFLLLILGLVDAARLCMVSQLLTLAAREGCRVGVTNTKTSTDVSNRVQAVLAGTGIAPSITVTPTALHWNSSASPGTKVGDTISVTLTVPFRNVSWLSSPLFFGSANITARAFMSSEHTQPIQ